MLTATDKDGGASPPASATITVDNVAPTAGVSGPADGVRGQARTFTLTASDPSGADRTAGFTFAVTWGDGTTQTVSGPSGTQVSHVYTASGAYSVKVTATDKDGGLSAAATQTVTITAAALQADPTDPSKTALVVGGTTAADSIKIKPADAAGTLNVQIGTTNLGNFKPTGHLIVYGQAGDDTIKLLTASIKGSGTVSVSTPAFLFGDDGNDTLNTQGSSANNVLEGGAGNDTLQAGSGRDLLVGGTGADVLHGDGGDDLLIGGTTDYDRNLAALNAVMAEWGRTDADYTTRVQHLSRTLSGGLNAGTVLTATTVHDDAASDTLFGEGGTDWFFALLSGTNKDTVKDKAPGELVTEL
jgi:Ca2+-binding RTX toxin-like protein